jgi:hypothetical protein
MIAMNPSDRNCRKDVSGGTPVAYRREAWPVTEFGAATAIGMVGNARAIGKDG